jgi:hypothetical protein
MRRRRGMQMRGRVRGVRSGIESGGRIILRGPWLGVWYWLW